MPTYSQLNCPTLFWGLESPTTVEIGEIRRCRFLNDIASLKQANQNASLGTKRNKLEETDLLPFATENHERGATHRQKQGS